MPSRLYLHLLVDRYAEALPVLDLNGNEQEEYSTMLLWLQNQVEAGEPNEKIVKQCVDRFSVESGKAYFLRRRFGLLPDTRLSALNAQRGGVKTHGHRESSRMRQQIFRLSHVFVKARYRRHTRRYRGSIR